MKYIVANTGMVEAHSFINISARRISRDGQIMLNEKDLASVPGDTFEEKLNLISGTELTESEALSELTKINWKL